MLVLFVAGFAALQFAWGEARETWIERLVVHQATVAPAAALIRTLTPDIPAQGAGPNIRAPGGGLNILNGCEGAEAIFLLAAALVAVRLPWRTRLTGLAIGTLLIFVLNEARIVVLFYAYRSDRSMFDLLHTVALPVGLIAAVAVFFYVWIRRDLVTVARAA
jgi:exosortase/archaeosortase family protein